MIKHPWLPAYPPHVVWDQEIPAKPLYALTEDTAARFPDGIAYDFMGRETSYRELLDQINRMAHGLQDLGVGKGSHVGIFMPNCPQFAIAYFGILKAGGTVVNYSPLYSERELIAQVEDSETDIMITLDLKVLYDTIQAVTRKSRLKYLVVDQFSKALPFPKNFLFRLLQGSRIARPVRDEYYVDFCRLLDNHGKVAPIDIDVYEDVAVIQYTGGTTGVPKGAMLTHANIYINVLQLEKWAIDIEWDQEVIPGFLPFFHVFSMTVIMNLGIYIGAKVFIMPKFELEAAVKLMKKHQPTIFAGVPTMFTALLNYATTSDADADADFGANTGLGNVKISMSGGAPMPVELEQAFKNRMNIAVSEGYGLTEASPVCTSNPYDRDTPKGSIGLPLPATEIIIIDRKNPEKIMPLGENGEICIRGPQVMKGYWKHPEATAKTIINGILHTGDVGYMDEDGYTYIIDRDKDLILVGGFNVYPRVVEEAIYQHPAVHEVTVIGVPDDYLGERPKAFVTLKNTAKQITSAELMAFLKDRIGKHERPREIEFRAELPKTMIGKLSKKELVAEEKAKYDKSKKA